MTACAACATELRASARFCDECGAPTVVSHRPAEYKQVTVLFADVVHSMDIAAAVGAERLREIMTELFERCAAVVQRFGGTVEKFIGDAVMAVFGAPAALEDHAFRACLASLEIQQQVRGLADEVQRQDGIALRLRVGLNSGRVVAGDLGSNPLSYTAIGEQVGLAQRMESVAPPGGVMLSEATARLVEGRVVLAEQELVQIKGVDMPVSARRLLAASPEHRHPGRQDPALVGRGWEMSTLTGMLDAAIGGSGGVVGIGGAPGIGKSRMVREVSAAAASRGVEVFTAYCESHASEIPFHAMTALLRTVLAVAGLDDEAARARVREHAPDADPQDLLLLDDLLGIRDSSIELPAIDPDARRRRLTRLVNTDSLARQMPVVYVIEDVHWIDQVSDLLLAEFLAVTRQTPSLVLITYRPEYRGVLTRTPNSQTITLGPLDAAQSASLVAELIGSHPSVTALSGQVADRAAGNPFFAEEMVRDLAERGVLTGGRGSYVCPVDDGDLVVPATLQATIAARIDRLDTAAKRTLNAASVIGLRFGAEQLVLLDGEAQIAPLIAAELVDQVRFTPRADYAFRHPLIRVVAYESQLKSGRAELHRRLAAAIEQRHPDALDESAALIAEHLEAGGELRAAYGWQMRAGAWSTNRDVGAARVSWERARRIADALSADDPDQLPMRIAPRTMLCATDWQGQAVQEGRGRFVELQELCSAAEDKVSLAIGMTGLATEFLFTARSREGSRLAAEQMALLESIGDPTLTIGLAFVAFANWFASGEFGEILRWSQTVVDLSGGDPAKGAGFGVGSPLAIGLAFRGVARWWLGRPGWRQDLDDAVTMARRRDPATLGLVLAWAYGLGLTYGVLRADGSAVRAIEEGVRSAQRASSDIGLIFAEYSLAVALLYQEDAVDRLRGLELMVQASEWQRERMPSLVSVTELWAARERAKRGDRDAAIPVMRKAADDLDQEGRLGYGVGGTGLLVETLLERGAEGDLAEAQEAIDRLAQLSADDGSAMLEITLLRLHALLARARGDDVTYRDLVSRYREMAESHGFEGHIVWAKAMVEGGE